MEPCDAKSIAETLIYKYGKNVEYDDILGHVPWASIASMSLNELGDLADEVESLIENAKITVTFEGDDK